MKKIFAIVSIITIFTFSSFANEIEHTPKEVEKSLPENILLLADENQSMENSQSTIDEQKSAIEKPQSTDSNTQSEIDEEKPEIKNSRLQSEKTRLSVKNSETKLKNNSNEKQEEFEFPEEKRLLKNVIHVDLGIPSSTLLFSSTKLLQDQLIRIPLTWQIAVSNHIGIVVNAETVSMSIIPAAFGLATGIAYFPLGKAPYDLFINLRTGATFGALFAFSLQTDLGWQFILKKDFVISLGANFAYYYAKDVKHFFIPCISIAIGWAF